MSKIYIELFIRYFKMNRLNAAIAQFLINNRENSTVGL